MEQNKIRVTITIDKDIKEKIVAYTKSKGMKVSSVVDILLREYLEENK